MRYPAAETRLRKIHVLARMERSPRSNFWSKPPTFAKTSLRAAMFAPWIMPGSDEAKGFKDCSSVRLDDSLRSVARVVEEDPSADTAAVALLEDIKDFVDELRGNVAIVVSEGDHVAP